MGLQFHLSLELLELGLDIFGIWGSEISGIGKVKSSHF